MGSEMCIRDSDDVQRAVRERMNRPIFLIDVSVPRNIDPVVRDVDNAFLFDIDDLEMHVEQNREERRAESFKAEAIAKEEVAIIQKWFQGLVVTPTIVALRRRAEEIKQAELIKVMNRLSELSDQDRETVEGLASSIVNKLIHGSLVTLKSTAQSSNGPIYIDAARRFYDLESSDELTEGEDPGDASDLAEASPLEQEGKTHPLEAKEGSKFSRGSNR